MFVLLNREVERKKNTPSGFPPPLKGFPASLARWAKGVADVGVVSSLQLSVAVSVSDDALGVELEMRLAREQRASERT